MAALTIDAAELRKDYVGRTAVRDLTLQVRRGEAFGFLGPNGAGKSTSIKMLLGLVKPTRGSALLLGQPLGTREVRAALDFFPSISVSTTGSPRPNLSRFTEGSAAWQSACYANAFPACWSA
jgi:ABC-type Mn2+/Zn2+ transport system ATPase subunit